MLPKPLAADALLAQQCLAVIQPNNVQSHAQNTYAYTPNQA
jgi:hypothetical protein